MKNFTRILCVVLVIALLGSVPVSAQKESSTWASSYFAAYTAWLSKTSDTNIRIYFDVIATRTMDVLGVSSIAVKRSADGVNWTTIRTFKSDNVPAMLDTETNDHYGYVTYIGTPGYYYKARVTFYAERGTGTGEQYLTTDVLRL